MTALALVLGGALLVQFLRKTNGGDGLDDDDDDFDLEIHTTVPDGSSGAAAPPPKFGVPSFNWGGHDNGLKMKGEV
jgi:hypothetical protein